MGWEAHATGRLRYSPATCADLFRLEAPGKAAAGAVAVVIAAADHAVVVNVDGEGRAELGTGAGSDLRGITANGRAEYREDVIASGKVRIDRIGLIVVFMQPGRAQFRTEDDVL